VIRAEPRTGTNLDGWTELETITQFVRAGDALTVTRVDELARSIRDLAAMVKRLDVKGASLRVIDQPVA
jgi:DNA invertase Pin-like site-specific DNA recombinase